LLQSIAGDEIYDLVVVNTQGQVWIKTKISFQNGKAMLEIGSIPDGMYFLKLTDSHGKVQNLPFMKLQN
jgi:hypothetical protein